MAAAAAALALAGCGRPAGEAAEAVAGVAPASAAAPSPAPSPTPSTRPADSIAAGDFTVTAVGQRDGDLLRVRRLEVRRTGLDEPLQVIDGLETETPWTTPDTGLQAPDMDFDGHPDLRLMAFRAAGPNTPWRHWRFDPASGRFVPSAALDALSPTRFDAARRLVILDWRDGAARSGSEAYVWQGDALQPYCGPQPDAAPHPTHPEPPCAALPPSRAPS